MGKAEVGTPKYIANKIKAKGLQKLRWYCQMCQKQCRDENGFKCHTTSESHQRQLLLFADNSHKYMDQFSKEFSDGYLELLRRQFGTKRVAANRVYQEYISDRDHLHMNSTKWLTLTDYIKWLGREGICIVDETEKGWFVTYIDRDPDTIAAQDALIKKDKMDKDDKAREMEFLKKQIKRAKKNEKNPTESVFTELVREGDNAVNLKLNLTSKRKWELPDPVTVNNALSTAESDKKKFKVPSFIPSSSKKQSALDDIIKDEESRKKKNRKDYWLATGIIVKVITNSVEKYYKKKAVILEVIDKYACKVKMLDSGDKLKLDQVHLETVIPAIGRSVLILNGGYRGNEATLLSIDERNFCVSIEIKGGGFSGRKIDNVPYEDISKLQ